MHQRMSLFDGPKVRPVPCSPHSQLGYQNGIAGLGYGRAVSANAFTDAYAAVPLRSGALQYFETLTSPANEQTYAARMFKERLTYFICDASREPHDYDRRKWIRAHRRTGTCRQRAEEVPSLNRESHRRNGNRRHWSDALVDHTMERKEFRTCR
jgi:hypothetical protein